MKKGHRFRGGISGILSGIGLAVLLQQFSVVALTLPVAVGVPIGMMLVGVAIGWPRPIRITT